VEDTKFHIESAPCNWKERYYKKRNKIGLYLHLCDGLVKLKKRGEENPIQVKGEMRKVREFRDGSDRGGGSFRRKVPLTEKKFHYEREGVMHRRMS